MSHLFHFRRMVGILTLCLAVTGGMILFGHMSAAFAQDGSLSEETAFEDQPAPPAELIDVEQAMSERSLGDPNAPITMVEFSSLSCPHCANFHENILPQLKENYIDTGKLRLVISDYPLDRAAMYATQMARCAPEERYFGLMDLLFRSQDRWVTSNDIPVALAQIGRMAGVSKELFNACIQHKELQEAIYGKLRKASSDWSIQSTPTFVFNDGDAKIEGALPYPEFVKTIERLLNE